MFCGACCISLLIFVNVLIALSFLSLVLNLNAYRFSGLI